MYYVYTHYYVITLCVHDFWMYYVHFNIVATFTMKISEDFPQYWHRIDDEMNNSLVFTQLSSVVKLYSVFRSAGF